MPGSVLSGTPQPFACGEVGATIFLYQGLPVMHRLKNISNPADRILFFDLKKLVYSERFFHFPDYRGVVVDPTLELGKVFFLLRGGRRGSVLPSLIYFVICLYCVQIALYCVLRMLWD